MEQREYVPEAGSALHRRMAPPLAPRRTHAITQHGETRVDEFFWLRDREDPSVLAYLEAENAYTQQAMARTLNLQAQLFAEMKGRIKETDRSAPARIGDYWYYTRTEEGRQYPIHCRRFVSLDAPEQMLLDQNALAAGSPYFRIGGFRVSPDHRWLAYSTDTSGDETYTLHIQNLETGEVLPDQITNTYYGIEWTNDSRAVLYNVLDDAKRPYKVFRHIVGADPASDTLLHHETDDAFFAWVSKTSSKAYLLIQLRSNTTTEVHYAPADQTDAEFAMFQPRQHGIEYQLNHHGDGPGEGRFLIVTNENALNFKLMTTPATAPSKENWTEMVPHRPDVLLEHVDAFRDFIARYERQDGLPRIRYTRPDGSDERDIAFPEPVYTLSPGANDEYGAAQLRFHYASMVTPNSVIDYDLAAGTWTVRKQEEIPSGHDPAHYETRRLMATAPDGCAIPISIVYKKGFSRGPALLTGYGAYGASYDPGFDARRLSLLDRGMAFAIAHVRGGDEMGRAWYENGKLLHKMNSFTDFIACAEHLIQQGYTSPDQLAILGASAGGLLMGAVMTLRPDLFHAVVADVPFVDVISTMSDPTIPLTVTEYEEWGNPADKVYFDYMKRYSPYDNVTTRDYPNVLVTAGLNDPRVQYWEPAKWVARLRAHQTDDHEILLKTNLSAGHGGSSGRYDYLRDWAFKYAFILDCLEVPAGEATPQPPAM